MALNHRPIEIPRHAFAQVVWRLSCGRSWQACRLALMLAIVRNGLIGRRRHVEQQFAQVGAAPDSPKVFLDGVTPARPHRATNHFLHRVLGLQAFGKRRTGHGRDDLADCHVMDRGARSQCASVRRFQDIGFNIDYRGLDVPEPVLTLVAAKRNPARVQMFPDLGW